MPKYTIRAQIKSGDSNSSELRYLSLLPDGSIAWELPGAAKIAQFKTYEYAWLTFQRAKRDITVVSDLSIAESRWVDVTTDRDFELSAIANQVENIKGADLAIWRELIAERIRKRDELMFGR